MKLIRIGEFAKLSGISEQTLRLYDKMGVFTPSHTDEDTGYRYYTADQILELDFISYLKLLGLPLSDIRQQLSNADHQFIRELMEEMERSISDRITQLEKQRQFIRRTIDGDDRLATPPILYTPILEYLPRRFLYTHDSGIEVYSGSGSYPYERGIHELRQKLTADGFPPVFFSNSGTIVSRENVLAGRLTSSLLYAGVGAEDADHPNVRIIPSHTYLSIYLDSFDDEPYYFKILIAKANSMNYVIDGDYLCEDLAGIPSFHSGKREHFYRIQIPIAPLQRL